MPATGDPIPQGTLLEVYALLGLDPTETVRVLVTPTFVLTESWAERGHPHLVHTIHVVTHDGPRPRT